MNAENKECPLLSGGAIRALRPEDLQEDDQSDNGKGTDWAEVLAFVKRLKFHWRLFAAIFALFLLTLVVIELAFKPVYTAVAILGPPAPSPTESMLANSGPLGAMGGLASKVLGSGAGDTSDPYQTFQQLLPSTRLSQALIEHNRNQFLQTIFYNSWDAQAKKWVPGSPIGYLKDAIKNLFGLPVVLSPSVDDLSLFFDGALTVNPSSKGATGGLLGSSAPYVEVDLDWEDPVQAEQLLSTVLFEADRIIREDQRRDVIARIAYLRQQLARQDIQGDERTTLISILGGQEQILTVIEADQRYASMLVVTPCASLIPTWPPRLLICLAIVGFGSFFCWIGLVLLSDKFPQVQTVLERLRLRRKQAG